MAEYWIPFESAHAREIVSSNARPQEVWCDASYSDRWVKSLEDRLWAYTLMVDEKPVACVGLILQDFGKAEAWALFAKDFQKHILNIYRIIRAGLDMAFKKKNLMRIQATIDPSYPETIRWIESLGFEKEGCLRRFGPQGQDFLMYSRLN